MQEEKKGTNWRAWGLGIVGTLFAIVALQNSQDTNIDVLFIDATMPLILVILVSAALGAAIGYVAPVLRRHRREERKAQE